MKLVIMNCRLRDKLGEDNHLATANFKILYF